MFYEQNCNTRFFFPKMIVRMCVVTYHSLGGRSDVIFVLSICQDYGNDKLLAAFECTEIWLFSYKFQEKYINFHKLVYSTLR